MNLTLEQYINETSDILTSSQDKNPLYFMFVIARMEAGSDVAALQTDYTLKQLFSFITKTCNKLDNNHIKALINAWPAGNVMIRFKESKKKKFQTVIEDILNEMKKYLISLTTKFTESLKIEKVFDELINSKELADFYATLYTKSL